MHVCTAKTVGPTGFILGNCQIRWQKHCWQLAKRATKPRVIYYLANSCFVFQIPREGIRGFPTNRYVIQIIKNKEAALDDGSSDVRDSHSQPLVLFCDDCKESSCFTCAYLKHRYHNLKDLPETNAEVKKEEQKRAGVCDKHTVRQPLNMFCDEPGCKENVCLTCVFLGHMGHRLKELGDMAA